MLSKDGQKFDGDYFIEYGFVLPAMSKCLNVLTLEVVQLIYQHNDSPCQYA